MEADVEVRRLGLGHHAQRIEVGGQVPARTVGGDQLADGALALITAAGAATASLPAAASLPAHGDLVDDRRMRHVTGFAAL